MTTQVEEEKEKKKIRETYFFLKLCLANAHISALYFKLCLQKIFSVLD